MSWLQAVQITDGIIKTTLGAIPDDSLSRMAFDTGMQLARGRNLSHSALVAVRNQLPPKVGAAFDTTTAPCEVKIGELS